MASGDVSPRAAAKLHVRLERAARFYPRGGFVGRFLGRAELILFGVQAELVRREVTPSAAHTLRREAFRMAAMT